ncbi:MAG: hypothetical protein F6K17_18135 [Okeania sp. SIO3C4]|nr:hypothetical protein [Okeania sp. SIO3C4]
MVLSQVYLQRFSLCLQYLINITAVFISVDHSRGEWHSPLQGFGYDDVVYQLAKAL